MIKFILPATFVSALFLAVGCAGADDAAPEVMEGNVDTEALQVDKPPTTTFGSSGAGTTACMAKTECTKRDLYGNCTCSKQTLCSAQGIASTFQNGSGCTAGSGLIRGF